MEMEIDIETEVFKKYPVTPDEPGCMIIRDLRNKARHDYRLKLLKKQREQATANSVQPTEYPPVETVGG
jgi:hypothetical protein